MANSTRRFLIPGFAAILLFAWATAPPASSAAQARRSPAAVEEASPAEPGLFLDVGQSGDSKSQSPRDKERKLRDEFIKNPPLTDSSSAPPATRGTKAAAPPPATPGSRKPSVRAFIPPSPAASPDEPEEIEVRGYALDPSGAIHIIGMDGVMSTLDGSVPVKLIFPPEYGLAPQVVGGTAPAPRAARGKAPLPAPASSGTDDEEASEGSGEAPGGFQNVLGTILQNFPMAVSGGGGQSSRGQGVSSQKRGSQASKASKQKAGSAQSGQSQQKKQKVIQPPGSGKIQQQQQPQQEKKIHTLGHDPN